MKIEILDDHETLSQQAAGRIVGQVRAQPASVICCASGDTPRRMCRIVADEIARQHVDFGRVALIGLDEWLGIDPSNEGSCHYFFRNEVLHPWKLREDQIHLFDAFAHDPLVECRKMDQLIRERGGLDLMIVGIGMNGHIGFNEPGQPFDLYSHVADLDKTTRSVGQKYFKEKTVLTQGITLGLQHLLEAKEVILMASGSAKVDVVARALTGPVTEQMPASVLRRHANATVMLDKEAAARVL